MKHIKLFEAWKKEYLQKMSMEDFAKIEKDSEVLFRGVRYTVDENTGVTLVLKPVKFGRPILVNYSMFCDYGAINESYKRPSATTKISGEYEIIIDGKVVNTQVAGFERQNDTEDSLYFMDNDPLRDTIGSLTVKNSDMPKLEKGTIIKAKSSKNGKEIQIKRIGDL